MRRKLLTLIVTFYSTTQAMRMEEKCRLNNTPGRMIPVPGEVSAGCGLAWSVEPTFRKEIEQLVSEYGIEIESMTEIMF